MNALKSTVLLVIMLSTSACSIRHEVRQDYPQYLSNNAGTSNLPVTNKASEYFLTPNTQQNSYEFRSVMTGAANLWVVEFGKMLDDTLMSADVQKAFGNIRKVSEISSASNGLLIFDLQNYSFEDFGAHITLKISFMRDGKAIFSQVYTQDGKTQGGKMFWGGVFGQKNSVQQSTKIALDEILRRLITDLNTNVK